MEHHAGLDDFEGEVRARLDFLASLNHELRTPLSGILGHSELLLNDRYLSPQQRRHAENIRAAGSALLTLANDVLNFAIADSSEIVIEAVPFDLLETVHAAVSGARSQAENKRIGFELTADPALPRRVVGDPDRIRQVLLNLCANAVKLTPLGRVRVAVELNGQEHGTARLRFAVTNSGSGMASLNSVGSREPGSPAGGGRDQFGGVGFALKVSRRLVEAMGGTMGIDGVPQFGSTVWFALSLPAASAGSQQSRVDAAPRLGPPVRVLLVEDDEINQEIARSILEAAGHEVDVACDGSIAVLAVQSNVYHLVLMDVQMPIMDGISATRLIRSLPGPECDVPIIAMTASVLPEQVRAFKEAGMNDHVAKPFRQDELLSIVNRWAFDSINQVIHSLSAPAGRARG